MSKNVLLIAGSPKGKKGNSESLLDYIQKCIGDKCSTTKIILRKEINDPEKQMRLINAADYIIISYPIYQNSFPGLVHELFEYILGNRALLGEKPRRMIAISNSGLTEIAANTCSIAQCKLFARQLGFLWGCGIMVAPGALINGKALSETGRTYAKTRRILEAVAERICTDNFENFDTNSLKMKSLFNSAFYRTAGKLLQNKTIKKLGKEKYYQRPLCSD